MRIRNRLLVLVLAILVPSFLAAALAVSYVYREEQKSQVQSVSESARASALMVDNELQARTAVLRTLATSPSLQQGQLREFYEHARRMAPDRETVIVLATPDGRQLINTRKPFGAELPQRRSSNIGALMRAGGPAGTYVSDLFMAPIGKAPDYSVQVPVIIDGTVRYHLLLGVNVATLQKLVERQQFRGAWTATVVDRQGVVLARSRHPERFVGKPVRAYSREILSAAREGVYDSRTLEGTEVRAFFSTVPMSEWKVLISIPVSEIRRVPLQAAAMLALLMATLLAAGMLAARRLAQRAIVPIEYLGHSADLLGQGGEPEYRPHGIVEIDSVAQRMIDAGRQIRQSQQELERRVAEAVAQTERVQGALLKAQKLESLGRLTGGIAHEFNNLLQTLSTALQLAELTTTQEKIKGLVQTCRKTVQRATALTGQLGAFGRIQEARQQTVDLGEQLASALQLVRGALREDIRLELDCEEALWPVTVEPLQFDLALLNLAVNARDAMPRGGLLRIEARRMSNPPQPLAAGDWVRLRVADEGTGMTPEVLAHALDPFFTTKAQGQGSGLGLAQAYAFATQSQGMLVLDSTPGAGTRVDIWLPRARQAVSKDVDAPAGLPLPATRGTVLFVEDDPLVREAVGQALRECGFEVLAAENGEQAIVLLEGGACPAVVFSDIVMPGAVSGIDLADFVRRRFPGLPVVLATGYTERQVALPGVQVLAKPYAIEKLLALLASAAGTATAEAYIR